MTASTAALEIVAVSEIVKAHPKIPLQQVLYVTRKKWRLNTRWNRPGLAGGAKLVMTSTKPRNRSARHIRNRHPFDELSFKRLGVTWVAREIVKRETGIDPETAERMEEDGKISAALYEKIKGSPDRKYFPKEEILAVLAGGGTPKAQRDKPRTAALIKMLPDEEFVTGAEAMLVDRHFTRSFLRSHTKMSRTFVGERPRKRELAAEAPTPVSLFVKRVNGQLAPQMIRGEWADRLNERGHSVLHRTYSLGDLRDQRVARRAIEAARR